VPITHTPDQRKALEIIGSQARYIELRGGARSGKTVLFVQATLARALAAKRSRHLVARFRGNALGSIFGPTGTFFWVLENAFPPEVKERLTHNSQMGFYTLPNGSEVWYGGLDDPKRVDKLLGNEYATILINEGSQVPYGSFTTVLTRLAQNAPRDDGTGNLRQKCYVDDNPPPETHWLARLFQKKQDPDTKRPLLNPLDYQTFLMNPEGNKENLDPTFLESLKNLPERQRNRFYLGKNGDAGEAALWTSELLDQQRVLDGSKIPKMIRKVVCVDPSGADDVEDTASDEIGIVVVGLGIDGKGYVLEDLTMRGSPGEWGKLATDALDRHEADCIVGESNFGGAMVRFVIQTAKPGVAYREVTASIGKHLRAEPVAGLFENDMARLFGRFPDLEDECCAMTTAGYTGTKSPNRLDAMVWGFTELFPKIIAQAKFENSGGIAIPRAPRVNLGYANAKRGRRR
jgi:hypothetical protein